MFCICCFMKCHILEKHFYKISLHMLLKASNVSVFDIKIIQGVQARLTKKQKKKQEKNKIKINTKADSIREKVLN